MAFLHETDLQTNTYHSYNSVESDSMLHADSDFLQEHQSGYYAEPDYRDTTPKIKSLLVTHRSSRNNINTLYRRKSCLISAYGKEGVEALPEFVEIQEEITDLLNQRDQERGHLRMLKGRR